MVAVNFGLMNQCNVRILIDVTEQLKQNRTSCQKLNEGYCFSIEKKIKTNATKFKPDLINKKQIKLNVKMSNIAFFYLFDLKVLRIWRNKSRGETVKTFIDKLVLWQLAGYMTGQVWDKIRTTVDSSVLPPETQIPNVTKRWDDEVDNVGAVPQVAPRGFEEDCKFLYCFRKFG